MCGLFHRRRKDPPPPVESEADARAEPHFDGSRTTYITGDTERDTNRVRLLIDSLRAVSSKTDPDELLGTMVDRAVRIVNAERGLLFTSDPEGRPILRVARGTGDRDLQKSSVTFSRQAVLSVLETGESVCKADDDGDAFDPSQSMINLNIRALMCVPLVFREQRQGVLYVDARAAERRFARGDLRFFEAFADMLSIVWTNRRIMEERLDALRMQRDLELAREIQTSLVPAAPLHAQGFTFCGRVLPASEAGGDYFDFFPTGDGRVALVVGDVSGHGAGPALLMSGARAYLRSQCQVSSSPAEVLSRLNHYLAGDMADDMFMSMFLCVLDPSTRQLLYANAGHPPALLLRADGSVSECARTGMALGVDDVLACGQCGPMTLGPGDLLLLYTDGIVELRRGDEQYGRNRLIESARRRNAQPPEELVEGLIADARSWGGSEGPQLDDLTLAILRAAP